MVQGYQSHGIILNDFHDRLGGVSIQEPRRARKRRTKLRVPKGGGVTVEAGPNSIVAIVAGPPDRYRMVDVTWKGKTLMLSTQNLRKRGERVDGAKA